MKFITNLISVDDEIYKNVVCFHQLNNLMSNTRLHGYLVGGYNAGK
jgi:hypothetical protein